MIKKALFVVLILFFTNNANAINASWLANDVNENVTKYTLYYKQEGTSVDSKVDTTTNGVSISDSSFQQGIVYVFAVTATNAIGESLKSTETRYTIPVTPPEEELVPETPSGIKITIQRPSVE